MILFSVKHFLNIILYFFTFMNEVEFNLKARNLSWIFKSMNAATTTDKVSDARTKVNP